MTTDPGNEELKKLKQDLEVSLSFRSLKFWPQILGFVHCFLYELVQLVELGLADLQTWMTFILTMIFYFSCPGSDQSYIRPFKSKRGMSHDLHDVILQL